MSLMMNPRLAAFSDLALLSELIARNKPSPAPIKLRNADFASSLIPIGGCEIAEIMLTAEALEFMTGEQI